MQPCHGHFTVMPKRPKCVVILLLFLLILPRHTFYFHAISQELLKIDTINTLLEPLRPADMCLLGFSLILLPIHFGDAANAPVPPKPQFLGREWAFSSQMGKIVKVSCYRNYCIDFNQIWRNDGDHQVVIVGGPSKRPTNPR